MADDLRKNLNAALASGEALADDPLTTHLANGLAYTIGSALGCPPPPSSDCLAAFLVPNSAGLTAGARAWSKHAHRSSSGATSATEADQGWWGAPRGSVATINERARALYEKVVPVATWRNLHWLPHQVLVYEVRVEEGYGMRWSQDLHGLVDGTAKVPVVDPARVDELKERPWVFRGFLEPMMENGHEVGWRHSVRWSICDASNMAAHAVLSLSRARYHTD